MGNIAGLYRRKGLTLKQVASTAESVVAELFPTLMAVEVHRDSIVFSWVHPEDQENLDVLAWFRYNSRKIGGKHLSCLGDLGYWLTYQLEAHISQKLGPDVKSWDEGVDETWRSDPLKYPTYWDYVNNDLVKSNPRRDFIIQMRCNLTRFPKGLDPKHYENIPDWVWTELTPQVTPQF